MGSSSNGKNSFWSSVAAIVASVALACCLGDGGDDGANGEASSAITVVQARSGGSGSTSATFTSPEVAGHLNVVIIGWGDSTHTITGVSDTRGNTYAVAAPMMTSAGTVSPPLRQAIYYAKNIAAGTNTITVTWNGTPSFPDLRILEYSGADPTAPFDATANGSGTASGGTVSSATATTTSANELVVGAGMTTNVYTGPGTSFAQRLISPDGNIAEDRSVTTAGSYSASAVLAGGSQSWLMQVATFKAQAGGAPAPTLTGVSPSSGTTAGGTPTTLTGTSFVSGATVRFCGVAATGVTFVSATQLGATTPAHAASTCDVQVTNPDGQSATKTAAYTFTATSNPIAWVQTKAGGSGATSAAFNASQTAGNLNVVIVGWGDNTHTISSVTDTKGNTYAVAAPMVTGTGTQSPPLRQAIYYAKNIAAGANTVNVTWNGTPTFPDLRIVEYSGLDLAAPFDVTAHASGTASGTSVSSGTATTTTANELLVGAGMTTGAFAGAGSGFAQRAITIDGNIAEDRIVNTAAGYGASATLGSGTQSWLMQMVAFKGSSGVCVPTTCAAQGKNCGTISDGCGGNLSCGTCTAPATCGGGGVANVCGTSSGGSYATTFLLTENPISEGGHWLNGDTNGLDWSDVRTTPGFAFGTQSGNSGLYDDSTALVTGTWNPNHTALATVRIVNPSSSGQREVELRLRSSISAHAIKGYEVLCNVNTSPNYGIQIVRWYGPEGVQGVGWDIIDGTPAMNCVHGDVLKASIVGNPPTITVWRNASQVLQATDPFPNPPTAGNPGIGFWNSGATNADYGLSSFSATGG